MTSLDKVLSSRYTTEQFEYIKSHPSRSALLRDLLQAHIDMIACFEECGDE
jgi:hypothetical protein